MSEVPLYQSCGVHGKRKRNKKRERLREKEREREGEERERERERERECCRVRHPRTGVPHL